MEDALLKDRLIKCAQAILDELEKTQDIEIIMGKKIDALKLKRSITLFYIAGTTEQDKIFKDIIDKFFKGEFCDLTIAKLQN